MTRKEQARMARLEAENRYLREALEHNQGVNRKMLYEIVDLKTKLELIDIALHGEAVKCP